MDCCICSPAASVYRLPRNAVCASCHEGARAIIAFLDNDDERHQDDDGGGGHGSAAIKPPRGGGAMKPNRSPKGLGDAWEQLKLMRDREEATSQRAAFLAHGFALAWKEGLHTDILVTPGSGPPIPAHRAVLAARSEVFRHALSADEQCNKAPAGDAIALPELSHDELSLFLAFLYTGSLLHDADDQDPPPEETLHALLVAGDKYDVPFLRRACEARLAARVEPRNALRTLEVAELSGSAALRDRAMAAVTDHAERVVFSPEYEEFAARNAGLAVEVTRALLMANKKKSSVTEG